MKKTIAEDSLFSNIFLDGRRHDWSNRFESDIIHFEMIHNFTGCLKMLRCKACEAVRKEAYFLYAAMKIGEHNAADEGFLKAR
jgi:hypothetical protein